MSNARLARRARLNAEWEQVILSGVAMARYVIGLCPDERILDEILAAEALHFFPRSNETGSRHHLPESIEQWAGFRLLGAADTAEAREFRARLLSDSYSFNPKREGMNRGASRRAARSGRHRNLKR